MPARTVFGWAMLAYAVSFGLIAVSSPGPYPIFGFMCAFVAFAAPFQMFFEGRVGPAHYLPGLIGGWINIVFLASVWIRWRSGNVRTFRILRITTLVMIPFSWRVMYDQDMYPREGHVLWIASMVVALFSAPVFEPFDGSGPSLDVRRQEG